MRTQAGLLLPARRSGVKVQSRRNNIAPRCPTIQTRWCRAASFRGCAPRAHARLSTLWPRIAFRTVRPSFSAVSTYNVCIGSSRIGTKYVPPSLGRRIKFLSPTVGFSPLQHSSSPPIDTPSCPRACHHPATHAHLHHLLERSEEPRGITLRYVSPTIRPYQRALIDRPKVTYSATIASCESSATSSHIPISISAQHAAAHTR